MYTRLAGLLLLVAAAPMLVTIHPAPAPVDPEVSLPPPFDGWIPPPWLDAGGAVSPWAVDAVDGPPARLHGPSVQSHAALIADLERGEVLWARRPDETRSVASLTKLISALTLVSEDPDLDRELCVGPEQYPPRPGARSRFETGVCHTGWDWLGAALVRSDNRGAMGLPALSGYHYDGFLERMGEVSRDLGMNGTTWADPSGIEDGNRASARDMARAVIGVAAHPTLSSIASAEHWQIQRQARAELLPTTNRLMSRWETLAAKTGYTDAAGFCFTAVVRSDGGGLYAVVVLGAPTSATRFADIVRLVQWADDLDCDPGTGTGCPSIL